MTKQSSPLHIFKGIHYQRPWFYQMQTWLKLRNDVNLRFHIAAKYIHPGESVLDLCGGLGTLKSFLPSDCHYTVMDHSSGFFKKLDEKNIPYIKHNLHLGIPKDTPQVDVAVMLISLCHFVQSSMHELLKELKKVAKRVIIIEEVKNKKRGSQSWIQKTINYLSMNEYYVHIELLSYKEFEDLCKQHEYQHTMYNDRYHIGIYKNKES